MQKKLLVLSCSLLFILLSLQAQQLNEEQFRFLENNSRTICTDETISSCDWSSLSGVVANKKMVLIGEPNHGSKEIFLLRNDLIKFLHEKHGFNVVLFESGIGELVIAEIHKEKMNPLQMSYGLFGGWRTKEFRQLMEYVKSANLSIAGFDVQRSGGSFKSLIYESASFIDTAFCNTLEDQYGYLHRELTNKAAVYDSLQPKVQKLVAGYREAYLAIAQKGTLPKEQLLLGRTLMNRVDYLEYMLRYTKEKNAHARWAARDSMMADNIRWLLETIYKNEKLIIIAHNFHVAKYNATESVMGQLLTRQFGDQSYVMGVFASKGSFANNAGKETIIVTPDSTKADIKHAINRLPQFANYLHIPQQKTAGSEWLFQNIVVNDTFIDLEDSNQMVLARYFDGLLFVNHTSMPDK